MLEVIDQRDRAEAALSEAYFLIIGRSPEWSNLFGYDEALEEIGDAQELLRKSIPQPSPPPDSAAPELPPALHWMKLYRNGIDQPPVDVPMYPDFVVRDLLASLRERLGAK